MFDAISRFGFILVVGIALTTCSGPSAKPDDTTPTAPPDARSAGNVPVPDGARDAGPGAPVVTTPPTKDECMALLDHMLRIKFSTHNKSKPDELKVTEDQLAVIREDLVPDLIPQCTTVFTRDDYNCSMAATTPEQWGACEQR